MPSFRVTQREIGQKAGVSHVTVSLALRGHHSIPEKTRERIVQIAEDLGYAPDPMLAGLSAYRQSRRPAVYQSNIAWIANHDKSKKLHHGIRQYYEGAERRCRELGYNLEEIDLREVENNHARLGRILAAKGIRGLLLAPCDSPNGELCMDLSRFSAVRFGYSYRHPTLHTVTNAQFRTALLTMQHLGELGYRRIGIILGHEFDERTAWNFLGGFRAGQQSIPKSSRVEPFYRDSIQRGRKIASWITKYKVDCVVDVGGAAYLDLKALGLGIPEEIGYANMDLTTFKTDVSGMYQNSLRIGASAVNLLVGMVQRGEQGIPDIPSHLYIESRWNPGKTSISLTGKVKADLKGPD